MNEWVSVKKRMPKKHVEVVVYGDVSSSGKGIDVDYVDDTGKFFYYDGDITHWLDLTPPDDEEYDRAGDDAESEER